MRLTLLLTTPRLPAGQLTGSAWRAIFSADAVLTADTGTALAHAVVAAGREVELLPEPSATLLLSRATSSDVVWLAADDGDEQLTAELAADVVHRSESGEAGAEVEVLLGSFDPPGARLLDLVAVMDRLRRECPWDQEQTHETLVRYLVEESYETIEAIETGDRGHLREELGDLLLQVMFHARIATEDPDDPFDIDDVTGQIVDKLIRRHPHVFAGVAVESAQDVNDNWETIKAAEKQRSSAMDGIPPGLPALSLADKVIGRAVSAARGVSVPEPAEVAYTAETLGEVLFALVAAARSAGIDAEQALRQRVRTEIDAVRLAEAELGHVRALPDQDADGG